MKKMDKKAFTLIELLVVVAVIAILVLLGMPRFIGHKDKAELARIQHDVKVMEQEIGTVLINGDDDFKKWEDNSKDLNQLAQENKLAEKEGIAEVPIGGSYKVIPEKYKDKINTKLKGTFYANNNGKVYYEHEKPLSGIPTEPEKEPEYSDEEIDDLIKNHDFIPVATADELNSIRKNEERIYGAGTQWEDVYLGGLDKNYVQVLNIDLSGYSEEEGWNPIGTFTGTYDGWKYVITNLEVKGEGKNNQGLFGRTNGATIRNVALEDINVNGGKYTGGLVGYADSGTNISNSYAEGSVEGSDRVGGLAGETWRSTISNSYTTGSVTSEGSVTNTNGIVVSATGGLVGQTYKSIIENSYSTGSVMGSGWFAGGLLGYAEDSTIDNSYAEGPVEGTVRVGGLLGRAHGNTNITNSYATGSVTGGSSVGGLVGIVYDTFGTSNKISNSYATGSVKGTSHDVGGLVGYVRGDNKTIENSYATGPVTGAGTLGGVGGLVGRTFGDNIKISKSYATGPVTGTIEVGGLVGLADKDSSYGDKSPTSLNISKSYATGEVTGTKYVGGLLGKADNRANATISNSYATGSVTGSENSRVGGLVGYTYGGMISNSYATGEVIGSGYYVRGFVGSGTNSGEISNSYWDIQTTKKTPPYTNPSMLGEGKTTEEMKLKATYSGWDFDTVWEIDEGNDYPKLR